ncbi:MAG: hypothetical protein K0R73_1282 [Candidatus Midichloriaceae bacterium]|jgi:hypothetical protein|nr:hypothetical protein [Candidatus Midichloriaceae bacterium]
MKTLLFCIKVALIFLFVPSAYAEQTQQPKAQLYHNYYITDNGWGELFISDSESLGSGVKEFDIEAVGANSHRCSLSGKILPTGVVEVDDDAGTCILQFKTDENGIEVIGEESGTSCRDFCGSRAYFTGYYNRVDNICEVLSAIYGHQDNDADEMHIIHKRIMPILKACSKPMYEDNKAD